MSDLCAALTGSASRFPDKTAIYFADREISYQKLDYLSNRFGSSLLSLGINKADRLAIILPNCPEFVVSYYGGLKAGCIIVPINPLLAPPEVKYILEDSGAKALVIFSPLIGALKDSLKQLPALKYIIVYPPVEAAAEEGFISFIELVSKEEPAAVAAARLPKILPDDVATFLYTSGTTGKPKGAILTHYNLWWDANACISFLKLSSEERILCVLPLFHAYAATCCMHLPINLSAATIILDRFSPELTLEAIEKYRATIFLGVPSMFATMLQVPKQYDLSSLKFCISGGAAMPQEIMRQFEARFGVVILEGDGPTECSPVVSCNPIDGIRKPGSVGLPLPGIEVKIFDEQDKELPTGEIGEIVVKGPNVMQGYLNLPEATEEALKNNWFHTGDLGKIDEDGYLYIVDRKKDLIIVGGYNVYPREVEEVLYTHPKIMDAAVIGIPDRLRGEVVKALIVLKPGELATAKDIISYCKGKLAPYKIPKIIEFRDALPKSLTGKVLKRLLRNKLS